MIIPINEKYRVKSDSMNWSIQKKIKPNSQRPDGWMSFKYYGTFEGAISGLINMEIRESEAETLLDAVNAVREITKEYTSIFDHTKQLLENDDARIEKQ